MTQTKTTEETKKTAAPKATTTKPDRHEQTVEEIFAEMLVSDPTLKFSISWNKIEPVYNRTLHSVAKNIRQDGFRPGKVPLSIAEERINRDYLIQEVMKATAQKAFDEARQKSEIKLFADPQLNVTKADKNADWEVTAYLPQKTEVKLPDYKKFLTNTKKRLLKEIQEEQKKIKQETEKNKDNKNKKAPALLTDEQMKARATDESLLALLREVRPKVSSILVQRAASQQLDKLAQQLQQYHLTLGDYFKQIGASEQAITQQYMLQALQDLQMEFILDALMTAEKITVTAEEIEAKLKETMPDVTDEAEKKRQLAEPSVHDYLELMAKRQKLAHWLLEL